MSLLKLAKEDRDEKKVTLRNIYDDHNLVFATGTKNYINRHTNATLLLMNDVNLKTVSTHLGHSDINITTNTHTDVLHARQKCVAELIDLN